MEERLMDDPRKIKVKRNAVGGVEDATDALAPDGEEVEIDVSEDIVLPEEELDEDLIGLAPSQLEKELERRKKEAEEAAAERDKLLAAAEERLKKEKYKDAEALFSQALVYDADCLRAKEGVWICRTRNYTETERLYDRGYAEEFSASDPEVKNVLRGKLGERLEEERKAAEAEAAPLRKKVRAAQRERRSAFIANRNYYRWRLLVFVAIFCAFVVAMSICGSQIVHVRENTPAYLTIAFGALALLDLIPIVILSRKFVVAQRLVSENEKLSSTEEGAKLEELEEDLEILSLYLDDTDEAADEDTDEAADEE